MISPLNCSSQTIANSGKRLLFIANEVAFFVSHRLPIANGAIKEGYEVHLAGPVGDGLSTVTQAGIIFHEIPIKRSARGLWGEAVTLIAICRVIQKIRPDIIHNATIKPVLYGSLAARIVGMSSIVNAISGLGYVFLARGPVAALQRLIIRLLYKAALSGERTRVIFQNETDANAFIAGRLVNRERSIVIDAGSGVNLRDFSPVPESSGPPMVVLAARMLVDKGVREFVAAAEIVRRKMPNARFILVGPLDLGNPAAIRLVDLKSWVDRGIVEWWGKRSDMADIFAVSHVVCLPSYREGLPKVLLEAAACGRAIVTTDVPGCRDAIIPGESGLIVAVRNPDALSAGITSLLENDTLRQAMGKRARQLAEERFGIDSVVKTTLTIYREVIG